jgi:hypothetical protein
MCSAKNKQKETSDIQDAMWGCVLASVPKFSQQTVLLHMDEKAEQWNTQM